MSVYFYKARLYYASCDDFNNRVDIAENLLLKSYGDNC